jgi:hypothetical protein
MRYWDGYAWLDNVSDQGAAASDPLGGKPMPAPSEVAATGTATATAPTGPPPSKSKAPLFIGIAAGVVVLLVVGFLVLRKDDSGGGVTTLKDQTLTFEEEGNDTVHPTVHTVRSDGNQVIFIDVESKEDGKTAGVIVETSQSVVDSLNSSIDGLSDDLKSKLKDACPNLREEDIGAKGNVAYFFASSADAKTKLESFTVAPLPGDFEVVPVLVDADGKCVAGKLTVTISAKPLDFSGVSNSDDLFSKLSDSPDLSKFFSS